MVHVYLVSHLFYLGYSSDLLFAVDKTAREWFCVGETERGRYISLPLLVYLYRNSKSEVSTDIENSHCRLSLSWDTLEEEEMKKQGQFHTRWNLISRCKLFIKQVKSEYSLCSPQLRWFFTFSNTWQKIFYAANHELNTPERAIFMCRNVTPITKVGLLWWMTLWWDGDYS